MVQAVQVAKDVLEVVMCLYVLYVTIFGAAFAVWLFFRLRKCDSLPADDTPTHHFNFPPSRNSPGSEENLGRQATLTRQPDLRGDSSDEINKVNKGDRTIKLMAIQSLLFSRMMFASKRFWIFLIGGAIYFGTVLHVLSGVIMFETDGAVRLRTLPTENQSVSCSEAR